MLKKWTADNPENVQYVLKHGCSNGIVAELVCYNQTIAFYDEYKDDINELIVNLGYL